MKLYSDSGRKSLYTFNERIDEILVKAVGEQYLEYRRLWKLTSSGKVELEFPLELNIELSTSCNLNCPMCPYSEGTPFKKMDFKMFKEIIDEGVKYGTKAVGLNYVNEPLMRKDIPEFVSYARKKGILDVMFNSNGMLLTEEMSKKLVLAGLTKLSVSLDAFSETTYDKIRIGGDFNKVCNNINRFLSIRKEMKSELPLLKLTFLITSVNINELDNFLSYWRDKADLISIQNMSNPFNGNKRKYVEESYMIKAGNITKRQKQFYCPSPFQRMAIRHDGVVIACCHFRGEELIIGNIKDNSLFEIYNNACAKKIRKSLLAGEYYEIPTCNDCERTTFKTSRGKDLI